MTESRLDAASILEPLPDIIWRKVAGETVLLDPAGKILMGLNGTGGRAWELLDGERSLGKIAGTLATHYRQEESRLLEDLLIFANSLLQAKLAQRTSL